MSEIIVYPLPAGANYVIPDVGDENWGQNVTDFLVAIPNGTVPTSGNFALTGDVSFTGGFGLVSPYFKTPTINPASTGIIRLAKTDFIDWRNNANSADLPLGINGSDQLTFNGVAFTTGGITALTGDATATGPGSVPLTFATVNSNVGSFTNAHVTVNAKGLITAASSGTTGNLTDVGTDGITITGGTGAVLGSGTTISQHVADSTHNGYLSSTDWSTFNSAAGGGITSLTGVVTGTGPGATATSFAPNPVFSGLITGGEIRLENSGNQINFVHAGTDQYFITAPAPGSGLQQTFTIPDNNVSSNTFALLEGTQTFSGAKTLNNAILGGNMNANSNKIISLASATTAGDALAYAQSSWSLASGSLTGALAMGSNKITNLANGTASTDAAAFGQIFVGFQADVQSTTSTAFTTTSNTFQTTHLSATITPTSASHRIKISVSGTTSIGTANHVAYVTVANGTTDLSGGNGFSMVYAQSSTLLGAIAFTYIDSPATTSAVTYNVRLKNDDNATTVSFPSSVGGSPTCVIILEEIV